MPENKTGFLVYTELKSGLRIINGFVCEYEFLPGECVMDCDKCPHAQDYYAGGHIGDKRLGDLNE